MASNVQELRPKPADSEKITINLGYVDLGRIDLLVQEGFSSNRTDLIRTAIRHHIQPPRPAPPRLPQPARAPRRRARAVRCPEGPRPRPAPLRPRRPRGGGRQRRA